MIRSCGGCYGTDCGGVRSLCKHLESISEELISLLVNCTVQPVSMCLQVSFVLRGKSCWTNCNLGGYFLALSSSSARCCNLIYKKDMKHIECLFGQV